MSILPNRREFRLNIALVLTASMVLVVVLLMSTITIRDIRRERIISRYNLENQGLLLANTLNDVLADALYYTDVGKPCDIAEIVRGQPDITYVRVFKPDGRLLVIDTMETDQDNYATGSIPTELAMSSIQSRGAVTQFEGEMLEIATPITAGAELLVGVELGFRTEALGTEIQRIIWQHIWQGSALIAIGVALSWLLA